MLDGLRDAGRGRSACKYTATSGRPCCRCHKQNTLRPVPSTRDAGEIARRGRQEYAGQDTSFDNIYPAALCKCLIHTASHLERRFPAVHARGGVLRRCPSQQKVSVLVPFPDPFQDSSSPSLQSTHLRLRGLHRGGRQMRTTKRLIDNRAAQASEEAQTR